MKRNRLGRTTAERGLRINGKKPTRRKPRVGKICQMPTAVNMDSPLADARIEMIDDTGATVAFENHDLNPLGVYLYSEFLLFEGEEMDLRLHLPSCPEPLSVHAEVDHANMNANPGMGVTFKKLSDQAQEHLQKYVKSKQGKDEQD